MNAPDPKINAHRRDVRRVLTRAWLTFSGSAILSAGLSIAAPGGPADILAALRGDNPYIIGLFFGSLLGIASFVAGLVDSVIRDHFSNSSFGRNFSRPMFYALEAALLVLFCTLVSLFGEGEGQVVAKDYGVAIAVGGIGTYPLQFWDSSRWVMVSISIGGGLFLLLSIAALF